MTCSRMAVIILGVVGLAGCGEPTPKVGDSLPARLTTDRTIEEIKGPALFEEIAARAGVDFTYRNGEEVNHLAILESLGGGVGLIDYDGDGKLDILFAGGGRFDGTKILGHPQRLFRNLGDWKFKDVTKEVGLDDVSFYSHGIAIADFDRDGWPDVAITGWGPVGLLHNVPASGGGRRFVDVSKKAGFAEHLWASSAAWGDLDGDGWPDLYVCQYGDWSFEKNHPLDCFYTGKLRDVCPPRRFKALPHRVFRNQKDGTFADQSAALSLRTDGKGLGVVMIDLQADGRPDLYVCNDTDENFLYLNRSTGGKMVLEEKGLLAGVARDDRGTPNGSMGVDAGDFDGSLRPSLWCTNYENELHALYRNDCEGDREFFQFASHRAGVGVIGQAFVGWGTGFADFEHRGWNDLLIANGHAIRYPAGSAKRQQRPVFFTNQAGKFRPATSRGGPYFSASHNARGMALGDLDNDGRIDVVISHLNEPAAVLRNVAPAGPHWIGFDLKGEKHRDLVGTRIYVSAGGRKQAGFIKGGGSFASSADRRVVFGLAKDSAIEAVEIHWSWGGIRTWQNLAVDRYHVLHEKD